MTEAICDKCGKPFMTDIYSTCGPCLTAPIARGVDAAILKRAQEFVKNNAPIARGVDAAILKRAQEFVRSNQAKRRRDGDSREPDGSTWRDRPPLL